MKQLKACVNVRVSHSLNYLRQLCQIMGLNLQGFIHLNKSQHKIIRSFLPKGQPLEDICDRQCLRIQNWMNDFPRK